MEERERQPAKVACSIDVIEAGRLIFLRASQYWNEFHPMDVIESGRLIFVRAEHSWNENDPMDVIDFGMITVCKLLKGENTPFKIILMVILAF